MGQNRRILNDADLDMDAWGRKKAVMDKSLFHGMFTYNIPVKKWYETINDTIQSTFTNCSSVDGALKVTAGATLNDTTYLRTFRCPRYEPNRGVIYSTAMWFNDPDAAMVRRFGQFTAEAGAFFELDNGTLYGVVRTTINSVTTDQRFEIQQTNYDLSKGNVFDIQYQWRGVGNYVFFVNLKEVESSRYLGTLTNLSMFNPASPLAFEAINEGDNDPMYFGCVDISSEGGSAGGRTFGSVSVDNEAGQVAISGYNQPVVAIRSKTTVNSLINTRDTLPVKAIAYGDQKAVFKIWETRDFTAITNGTQTWSDFGDGHLEYLVYDPDAGTPATFDTAKADQFFATRVNLDDYYSSSFLEDGGSNIWINPGDMIIMTMHRENGGAMNAGTTLTFAEEI